MVRFSWNIKTLLERGRENREVQRRDFLLRRKGARTITKTNGTIINCFGEDFKSTLQNISPTLCDVPKFYASFSTDRILQRLYFRCLYKKKIKMKNSRRLT
jgi:hypothetical protein